MNETRNLIARGWFYSALLLGAASSLLYLGCSDDDVAPTTDGGSEGSTPTPPPPPGPVEGDAGACPDAPPASCEKESDVEKDLRCTGLYACWSTKEVAATHREYAPAYPLWSDGAEKTRWLELPAGSKIDTGGNDAGTVDEWQFPVGTKVYKEFKLAGKRIETRRIWKKDASTFVYSVWRWSDDESSATLMNSGATVPNPLTGGDGQPPATVYEIPSNGSCATCHDGHRDKLLSLDAWQLAAGATGITLDSLKTEGLLTDWPHTTTFETPQDATNKFDKVVSFVYGNCSFCHKPGRPGGATNLHLYLPVKEPLEASGGASPLTVFGGDTPIFLTTVNQPHVNQTVLYPLADWLRVWPKEPSKSVLVARDEARDTDGGISPVQMPNVVSRIPDPAGMAAVKDWITALP